MALSTPALEISIPTPADGERLLELARGVQLFTAEDVEIIHELWDEFITRGKDSCYSFIVARRDGKLHGFASYGRRALTKGTWDLYWLGVDQASQGQGIGRNLLCEVKERVRQSGGRLLIIETEGKPEYEPTRQFYLHSGCTLEARICDFYAPGDDLFIFTLRL